MSTFSQLELFSVLQITYACWFTDLALPVVQYFNRNLLQAEAV